MVDRLVETGRNFEWKFNVDESKVMRISRKEEPLRIVVESQELENID